MALTAVTAFGAQSRASSAILSLKDLRLLCRGKLLSRVDNHIIWLEPFLKYNMGPFSWLYERMRPISGKIFGFAGQGPASLPGLQVCAPRSCLNQRLSEIACQDCLVLPNLARNAASSAGRLKLADFVEQVSTSAMFYVDGAFFPSLAHQRAQSTAFAAHRALNVPHPGVVEQQRGDALLSSVQCLNRLQMYPVELFVADLPFALCGGVMRVRT